MDNLDSEARAFLKEFQQQPDEVRRLFLYVICQTMDQAGMLECVGAFNTPRPWGHAPLQNPDSGEIFEIVKPEMSTEEEHAMRAHIGELLQGQARSAA